MLKRIKRWYKYRGCEKKELCSINLSWLEYLASQHMQYGWTVYRGIHVHTTSYGWTGYRVILVKPEED